MSRADQIRHFARIQYVEPARASGSIEVEIHAGIVHREMGLVNRFPAICSAIDAARFRDECGLSLVKRTGPRQSSSVVWRFALESRTPAVIRSVALSSKRVDPPQSLEGDRSTLEVMRWKIIEVVRTLDAGHPCRVPLGESVRRLMEAGRIPETTGRMIFVVLGLRNRVVYKQRELTNLDRSQLGDICRAIERWMCGRSQAAA